ncbi:MAG TPA: tRNA (adenosine(37)-N6)-dimethylallyltransferase MiaA [Chloroflexota bacterium]|nr:tRNA (adenosine(37)-N6)-dimethylallyltransferase MiaA [Chloroflexota bacterium]
MQETPPKLIAIVGPTAVGKSALAFSLARRGDEDLGRAGEIVSADSRQVYRELDIGTAKPTVDEQRQVRHHVIDVVDPEDDFSLAEFQDLAYLASDDIIARGRLPLLVGGTGLYVRSIVEGLNLPRVAPDPELRAELEAIARDLGADALHRRLAERDPLAASRIDRRNIRRVVRALEVVLKTGRPFSDGTVPHPRYDVLTLGVKTDRATLYQTIDERVDAQLAAGLLGETQRVLARGCPPDRPALNGFGYRELQAYLRGETDLATAVERYKFETHRFARQQENWFRLTDARICWIQRGPGAYDEACRLVRRFLSSKSADRADGTVSVLRGDREVFQDAGHR